MTWLWITQSINKYYYRGSRPTYYWTRNKNWHHFETRDSISVSRTWDTRNTNRRHHSFVRDFLWAWGQFAAATPANQRCSFSRSSSLGAFGYLVLPNCGNPEVRRYWSLAFLQLKLLPITVAIQDCASNWYRAFINCIDFRRNSLCVKDTGLGSLSDRFTSNTARQTPWSRTKH